VNHQPLMEYIEGKFCLHEELLTQQATLRRALVDIYPSICVPFGWSDELYDLGIAIKIMLKIQHLDDHAIIEDWIIPHILYIARQYHSAMEAGTVSRLIELEKQVMPRLKDKNKYAARSTITEYEFNGHFAYFPVSYFVLNGLMAEDKSQRILALALGDYMLGQCHRHENYDNIKDWFDRCYNRILKKEDTDSICFMFGIIEQDNE